MAIKKHLKIWAYYFKFSLISATTYRASFFVELFVEFGYCFWAYFFIQVAYSNVKEIAGWNHNEMLFLIGLSIVFGEFFVALFYVWGFRTIPHKIKNGEIDFALLKPVNGLFNLSTGTPYISGLVSVLPGIYLMAQAAKNLHIAFNLLDVLMAIYLSLCGLVIAYAMSVILVSLAFIFLDAKFLPEIALKVSEYSQNPHEAYSFIGLKILFFLIAPVVFMVSLPASAIIKTINPIYLIMATCLAFLFFLSAVKLWNFLIKRYVSASS